MTTQTDPNIDPADAHEQYWPTDTAEAAAAIDKLRARLLPLLERRHPVDSVHSVDVRITPGIDGPEYAVHCTATSGAPCRRSCAGDFEGRCGARCADDCDGSLADTGQCLAALELDHSEGRPLHNAYVGPERALEPGPIVVRRDPEGWSWLYAADLPEGVTPEEWTHAQP